MNSHCKYQHQKPDSTGTASVARAWSSTFDNLIEQRISIFFRSIMTMKVPGNVLAEYPDLFALILIMLLTALMAFLFDLAALVDLMSIGTLLAYSLVAISVLILRYQPGMLGSPSQREKLVELVGGEKVAVTSGSGDEFGLDLDDHVPRETFSYKLLFVPTRDSPTKMSGTIVYAVTAVISVLITALCAVLAVWLDELMKGNFVVLAVCVILTILCFLCVIIIWRQPESKEALTFKVPLLPWLPLFSVFVNIYLMMQLDLATWARFAVWMAIGFLIYFFYGISHSSEAQNSSQRKKNKKSPIYLAVDNSEMENSAP
ncbi:Cationic amino acid transporter 3 [Bagarius yarrelli]|uniref:Cationic amino acid transporter 3 n=1 Tax=Bagarius yarrelli TaxID=175774 RepID=A0A556TX98_BAGYA|nr:Cationic amino acid transporter 3 [Bagarius yarrelli]